MNRLLNKMTSCILALVVMLSCVSMASAETPTTHSHDHDHDCSVASDCDVDAVYQIVSEDARYIVGRDSDGNTRIFDKKQIAFDLRTRAVCNHPRSQKEITVTEGNHSAESPRCTYTKTFRTFCFVCNRYVSETTNKYTHPWSPSCF